MDTFLYFAYGSNMLTARLVDRCSSARVRSVAFAPGYQVKFWKRSLDGSGKCTLVDASAEQAASGVLFEINSNDLPALDEAEGVGAGYIRVGNFAVRRADTGETVQTTTYIASSTNPKLAPYDWYLALVVAGATEHGLGNETLAMLRATQSIGDPKEDRSTRSRALQILESEQINYLRIITAELSSPTK